MAKEGGQIKSGVDDELLADEKESDSPADRTAEHAAETRDAAAEALKPELIFDDFRSPESTDENHAEAEHVRENCRDVFSNSPADGIYSYGKINTGEKSQNEIDSMGREVVSYVYKLAEKLDCRMEYDELIKKIGHIESYIFSNYEILKKNSLYTPYVENSIIKSVLDDIQKLTGLSLNREITPSSKINNYIKRLQQNAKALHSRFHPTGTGYMAIKIEAKPQISSEHTSQIEKITQLTEEGRLDEAMDENRKISDSCAIYNDYHEEGGHNFMKINEMPDVITQFVQHTIMTDERFKEFREMQTRILEFGPGVGNDAVQLIKNLPNIIGYHAIDGSVKSVNITRSRMEDLKNSGIVSGDFGFNVIEANFLEWLKKVGYHDDHYKGDLPRNERLIVFSKSTLHYFLRPIFEKFILPNLFHCTWAGRGLLVLSMKDPSSDTWKDHDPIYDAWKKREQDGYLCGLHKTPDKKERRIMRAFIEKTTLMRMLDKAGFEVIARNENKEIIEDEHGMIMASDKALVKTIGHHGYDHDQKRESFTVIMARPKRIQGQI